MTDNDHKLTTHEIENAIATLIGELTKTVSIYKGETTELAQRKRLLCLAENAASELEMWGRAVGHTSWLASTHEEAAENTINSLGIIGLMQGQLLSINSQLDDLKWSVTHEYDAKTNTVTAVDPKY